MITPLLALCSKHIPGSKFGHILDSMKVHDVAPGSLRSDENFKFRITKINISKWLRANKEAFDCPVIVLRCIHKHIYFLSIICNYSFPILSSSLNPWPWASSPHKNDIKFFMYSWVSKQRERQNSSMVWFLQHKWRGLMHKTTHLFQRISTNCLPVGLVLFACSSFPVSLKAGQEHTLD